MAIKKATFAGGCFWCMVMPFDAYDGVLEVVSGYTGGSLEQPGYQEVKTGKTGHLEAVEVTFDDEIICYTELLEIFWKQIDPTDDGGQFGDRGASYRTAVFVHDKDQKKEAESSRDALAISGRFNRPIATRILPALPFYPAEEYHQNFAKREPERYDADKAVQERRAFLKGVWGKAEDKER